MARQTNSRLGRNHTPFGRRSQWKNTFPLLVVLGLLLAACGGDADETDPAPDEPAEDESASADVDEDVPLFTMTFANITSAGELQVAIQEGVVTAADTVGVELTLYDNNVDDETALSNAELMINQSPDVIAEFNLSAAVNETLGQRFNEAGIPCIGVNIPVPGCPWYRLDNGGLGADTGAVMAEFASERGWEGDNTTVILLSAWAAGEDVNAGIGMFYQAIADKLPNMEAIDTASIGPQTTRIGDNFIQVDTDLLLETGFQGVNAVLPSVPAERNIIIFGVNDDVVSGAVRAIEEDGRTENTIVAGLGGREGVESLRSNPIWLAEADVFFDFWGQYIVAMGAALHQGVDVPDITVMPTAILTEENVEDFYDPGETTPRSLPPVPPENEYLIPLGILQQFDNIEDLN